MRDDSRVEGGAGNNEIVDCGLEQRSANFFYKGPESKYFECYRPYFCVAATQLCCRSMRAAIDINK